MILWHYNIIPLLPNQLLSALHRDICHVRGGKWGIKMQGMSASMIVSYHALVLDEMEHREWQPCPKWKQIEYRGKKQLPYPAWFFPNNSANHTDDLKFNISLGMSHKQFKLHLSIVKEWEKNHGN